MDDHGPAQPTDLTLQSTAPGTGRVCAAMVIMGPCVDIRMKNASHWQTPTEQCAGRKRNNLQSKVIICLAIYFLLAGLWLNISA